MRTRLHSQTTFDADEAAAQGAETSGLSGEQLRGRFNAVFHNTFQFMCLVSTDGDVLEINQPALKFAGARAGEVLGKPFAAMTWWTQPEGKAKIEAALFRASGGEFVRYATELLSFEGVAAVVDFSLKPVFNASGDIDFFVAEGRDITALKKIEFERDRERTLADTLQKLNELKNEFVSSVSHELRTPLASIIGFAQTLLRDPNLPRDKAERFLNIILQDGQRLSRLVEDLLDLSRIESGKIQLLAAPANIAEVIEYAASIINPEATSKGITLETTLPTEPVTLVIDRDRITQVLVNLLDNAVKFTPAGGGVVVRLALEQNGARQAALVSVSDTGLGIPEEDLPRLFQKFYRVSRPGKEIRGTGLGLAIAKQIVELHDGSISAQSQAGKGSTFLVTLPIG